MKCTRERYGMSNHLVYNDRCVEVEKSGDNDQMGKLTLWCRVKCKSYIALNMVRYLENPSLL